VNWLSWWRRYFGARRRGFLLPAIVFEVEPNFLLGARVDSSARRLRRFALRELGGGSVEPATNRANIVNEASLKETVRDVAAAIGERRGRFGLLLPDGAIRAAVLAFETVPSDPRELEALVRWRLRSSLPFPVEEARISYQVSSCQPGQVELLVLAGRNSVFAEYEAVFEHLNGGSVLTLPATAALLPLLPAHTAGAQRLMHVCCGAVTTVVTMGNRVCLWRHRQLDTEAPQELSADVVREGARAAASVHDQQGLEIDQIWLCARPPMPSGWETDLNHITGKPVARLNSALPSLVRSTPVSCTTARPWRD